MALPAIERSVVCLVTTPAKSHIERLDLARNNHLFDLAMTEGTHFRDIFDLHSRVIKDKFSQMLFVGKVDEIRDIMHLLPWRRFMFFPVLCQFLDAGFIGSNDTVASHALAGRRYTGNLATACVGMTIHAVDLVDVCMYVVWKLYGLFYIFTIIRTHWRDGIRHLGTGSHWKRHNCREYNSAA